MWQKPILVSLPYLYLYRLYRLVIHLKVIYSFGLVLLNCDHYS